MSDQRIVFQNNEGGVSVICPNYEGGFTIEDAVNSVPLGKPYAIVEASDIPSDRSQRMAWVVDVADLTDGVGA